MALVSSITQHTADQQHVRLNCRSYNGNERHPTCYWSHCIHYSYRGSNHQKHQNFFEQKRFQLPIITKKIDDEYKRLTILNTMSIFSQNSFWITSI